MELPAVLNRSAVRTIERLFVCFLKMNDIFAMSGRGILSSNLV